MYDAIANRSTFAVVPSGLWTADGADADAELRRAAMGAKTRFPEDVDSVAVAVETEVQTRHAHELASLSFAPLRHCDREQRRLRAGREEPEPERTSLLALVDVVSFNRRVKTEARGTSPQKNSCLAPYWRLKKMCPNGIFT